MRCWPLIAITAMLMAGCAWSPSRDNPVDPRSDIYVSPPQFNRPPVIDTVFVVSDCWASELPSFCWIDVVAKVSDEDDNLDYDSVTVSIGPHDLGPMPFDPTAVEFRLRRSQTDFPNDDLDGLIGQVVRVIALDDSGRHDVLDISFPTPVRGPAPEILYPGDPSVYNPANMDQVIGDTVRLSWSLWGATTGDHRYSAHVYFRNIFLEWDTTGLLPTDTSVVVTEALQPATIDGSIYYTWYLSVTDRQGNRITSLPGYFRYFPNPEPPAARKPESMVVN